jgi:hypothetical protein
MASNEQYRELLEEMLDLAGIPLNEADDEEGDATGEEEPEQDQKAADDAGADDNPDEEESDEELADKWSVQISTGSKMEIEFHDTYIYVWYRNRKSEKISIPQKLRQRIGEVSSLFNKILSHVEKVS